MANEQPDEPKKVVNPYVQAIQDQQAIEEAQLAILAARQKRIASYIPDVSNFKGDSLEAAEGNAPIGSTVVAAEALHEAAVKVAKRVTPQHDWKVFVTSESNLASLDGRYRGLNVGIAELTALADRTLSLGPPKSIPPTPLRIEPSGTKPQDDDSRHGILEAVRDMDVLLAQQPESTLGKVGSLGGGIAGAVVTAAAIAAGGPLTAVPFGIAAATGLINTLPSLLAALQTKRTVSGQAAQVSDLAATLEVAAALYSYEKSGGNPLVVHHEFRFEFSETDLETKYTVLIEKRRDLAKQGLDFSQPRLEIQQKKEVATAIVGALEKELEGAKDEKREEILNYLTRLGVHLAELNRLQTETTEASNLISSSMEAIDVFTTAAQATPSDGNRSAYADAVLMSGLMAGSTSQPGTNWMILLIKALPGTLSSSREDGGIGRGDGYLAIGEVALTYALLEVPSMALQTAGTVVGDYRLFTPIASKDADAVAVPARQNGRRLPWR